MSCSKLKHQTAHGNRDKPQQRLAGLTSSPHVTSLSWEARAAAHSGTHSPSTAMGRDQGMQQQHHPLCLQGFSSEEVLKHCVAGTAQ